jgi:predicted transglutaminase-like cysteine proteinase
MPGLFRGVAGALLALVALTGAATAASVDFTNVAFAPVAAATSVPVGAAEFCKARRGECGPNAIQREVEILTDRNWAQLVGINDHVNATVAPVTDQELYDIAEYWTYPNGSGDCEDFALEKRRLLIANGWAPSTLLMTVVRQANGEGHAVLMVRTDRGDLVLDNQDNRILLWNDTPYQFVKRQSQADSRQWVSIEDMRAPLYTATSR